MSDHDETRLPRWAQERLENLRAENGVLARRNSELRASHRVLQADWFTLPGPVEEGEESRKLFILGREGAQPICTLGRGDVLLVGRAAKETASDGDL